MGLPFQRCSTNTKRYFPKKVFGNFEFCSSRLNLSLEILWFGWEEQNSEFPKTFFGRYLFVFVEYVCNRSLEIKTKHIKNYSLILAIINHHNWLDDSPPLKNIALARFLMNLCKLHFILHFSSLNIILLKHAPKPEMVNWHQSYENKLLVQGLKQR